MKEYKFQIPIYKVDVLVIQIEGAQDLDRVKALCTSNDIEMTETFERNIVQEFKNGGDTYRNLDKRRIILFLYPFDDMRERANIIAHEKRHIEDRVLNYFGVDDVESAAMLAGYLGEEFFNFDCSDGGDPVYMGHTESQ